MRIHPFRHTPTALLALCVILALVAPPAVHVSARQDEPVTYYAGLPVTGELGPIDPGLTGGGFVADIVENIFLGLQDVEPGTMDLRPELAVTWRTDNSRVWTITLRDDVPWVRWNPVTGQVEVVRMVTAHDVVYGIQRACDPRLEADYIQLLIQGCADLHGMLPDQVTDDDYDLVQVQALDDTTVQVELEHAAAYFRNVTVTARYYPVPREIVEEYGLDWTAPEYIVTNGPFAVQEAIPGYRYVLVHNPHFPDDMRGPGNVERVELYAVAPPLYLRLYEIHELDSTFIWSWDIPTITPDMAADLVVHFDPSVVYLGFTYDKPPFDNVHVRRAFSAAFDSVRFVEEGEAAYFREPMIHLTPPGVFGAPPIDEVGVGYDPEYAREQLALGGYPDCVGFPEFDMQVPNGGTRWGDFLSASIVDTLGCRDDLVTIREVPFEDYWATLDPAFSPEMRPEIWMGWWQSDYLDAQNWTGELLGCEMPMPFVRPCTAVDDLLLLAKTEPDLIKRAALYYEIEERFFGPEGEHPLIPGLIFVDHILVKPWVDGPFTNDAMTVMVGLHFDWYTIDQAAQLAARGG